MIPWTSILELAARALPAVAQAIVAVLHFSGADQHKTIAGQLADGLQKAGQAASDLHGYLMNGVSEVPSWSGAPGAVPPGATKP